MKSFHIFNKKENEKTVYRMIVDRGNGYYSWNGKLYHSDIVRSCIKPRAKAVGKCIGKHIKTTYAKTQNGIEKQVEVNQDVHIRFLLEEPNELMSGQMMQEKVANMLTLNGNAFILILRDDNGIPCGLYPIPSETAEAKYDDEGNLFIKFYYTNGRNDTFSYKDIIHLRDDYMFNTVFGENPQEAIVSVMDTVTIADQGLRNAIKNSAIVRWLLKFTASLRSEDIKEAAKAFADDYLNVESGANIGVAATDAKADAIQVKPHNYVPNDKQADRQVKRIYAFFQTNEKIVDSSYSEDEWISYYEQAVEPLVSQMSREYTRKLFSRMDRFKGNEIIFESSALTFASMKSKLNLVQFVDRGIMTPNEVRGYLNLAPIEGGDKALLRKDTGIMGQEDKDQ